MIARRFLTIIQDPRGYPPPDGPRDLAPPDGPAEPMVHSVVMADAYEELLAERNDLHSSLVAIRDAVGPLASGEADPEQAQVLGEWIMQTAAAALGENQREEP